VSQHHCHAVRCLTPCKPQFLMCGRHWSMVPGLWQQLVLRHYRRGQCDDKSPSFEWCVAADCAVAAVARRENQPKPWGTTFTAAFYRDRSKDDFLAAYDAMVGERLGAAAPATGAKT
jgi:hypothetical protein